MPRKKIEYTKEYFDAFPTRLRELMNKSVSHQELANEIGKTRQMVGNYVNGFSRPDWKTLAKIADFFNVSTDYLSGRTDIPSRNEVVQNINAETGLSQEAIFLLMERKEGNHDQVTKFLSHLIKDVNLPVLIAAIRCRNNFKDSGECKIIEAEKYTNSVYLENIYKAEADDIFWKIVSTYNPEKEG